MSDRRDESLELRRRAAQIAFDRVHEPQLASGEEEAYVAGAQKSYAASFTKGLEHDPVTGLVRPEQYRALRYALGTGRDEDFALVPFGTSDKPRKFVNPTAGLAHTIEGPDSGSLAIPPAPEVSSAEVAAEMAELYWMALLRDVNFAHIEAASGPDAGLINAAVTQLNKLAWFNGATALDPDRKRRNVTPATLFRGVTKGDDIGPYVSQFLLAGTDTLADRAPPPDLAAALAGKVRFGAVTIDQRITPAKAGRDWMTQWNEWLKIQDGHDPGAADEFEATPRFIATPRDLATYVHFDQLYQAYFTACLVLLAQGARFDPGLPFEGSKRQEGFGTFGGTHVLTLVAEVATRALKAVWRQKWLVHRRLRPEALAGLFERYRLDPGPGGAVEFVGPALDELEKSDVLNRIELHEPGGPVVGAQGTHLLPMAFPEGSPMHPAYGAGHATVAGACVTILKAFFKEDEALPFAVQADPDDPTVLKDLPALAGKLTVGDELNKLASNISIGRNMAGVHYFTDYIESIRLGEQIACGILEEQALFFPEDFSMSFTRFDRTPAGEDVRTTIRKVGDAVEKVDEVLGPSP